MDQQCVTLSTSKCFTRLDSLLPIPNTQLQRHGWTCRPLTEHSSPPWFEVLSSTETYRPIRHVIEGSPYENLAILLHLGDLVRDLEWEETIRVLSHRHAASQTKIRPKLTGMIGMLLFFFHSFFLWFSLGSSRQQSINSVSSILIFFFFLYRTSHFAPTIVCRVPTRSRLPYSVASTASMLCNYQNLLYFSSSP